MDGNVRLTPHSDRTFHRTFPVFSAAFFVLALCSCEKPAGPAQGGGKIETLARLVPADASMVFYCKSIDDMTRKSQEYAVAMSGTPRDTFELRKSIAGDYHFDPSMMRSDGPLLLAIEYAGQRFMPFYGTTIFESPDPATLEEKVKTSPRQPVTAHLGNTVAVSENPQFKVPAAPQPICQQLLEGDVALRLDAVQLFKSLGSQFDTAIASIEEQYDRIGPAGEGPKSMLQSMAKFARATETVDIGVLADVRKTKLSFQIKAGEYTKNPGGPAAPNPVELLKFLPKGSMMQVAAAVDMRTITEWSQSMVESSLAVYPEPARKGLGNYYRKIMSAAELMGDRFACSIHLDPAGIRYMVLAPTEHSEQFVKAYFAALSAPAPPDFPLSIERGTGKTLNGVSVSSVKFKMDLAKMMQANMPSGPEARQIDALVKSMPIFKQFESGIEFWLAPLPNMAVLGVCSESEMSTTIRNIQSNQGSLPPEAAPYAGSRVHPAFVAIVDARALISGVGDMVAGALPPGSFPEMPAGEPAPIVCAGWSSNDRWCGELAFNFEQLTTLFARPASGKPK
jgi:hypothetical protein